jgi:hypothetical protein
MSLCNFLASIWDKLKKVFYVTSTVHEYTLLILTTT